ncbi:MAG: TetR/AcrR family transcriptional regulator [Rhodococcus sp.]|nr:TetR/AcrR family transcriptional regulator [Rhodococcus sp. (in: high G+C Gram-positive bacteria)]
MMLVHGGESRGRGPGRPRDEFIDAKVLESTLALIDAGEPVTVSRIVAASGISRSAIYRRWPSLAALVAAALDIGRASPKPVDAGADLRERLLQSFLDLPGGVYPMDKRMRQRIRLAMEDRDLQRAYWDAHVKRRREPLEAALRLGVEEGILRADLDVEASCDLIAGVFYYQLVVRGDYLDQEETRERCRTAINIAWAGMAAPSPHGA